VIGKEQKFVCLTFIVEANSRRTIPSKMPTWKHFLYFGTKSLSGGGKLVHDIYENPNTPRANKSFVPKLYKFYNLYILIDFYLVLWREVCSRSSQPHGHSMKRP
jgi:hypothetical protein